MKVYAIQVFDKDRNEWVNEGNLYYKYWDHVATSFANVAISRPNERFRIVSRVDGSEWKPCFS